MSNYVVWCEESGYPPRSFEYHKDAAEHADWLSQQVKGIVAVYCVYYGYENGEIRHKQTL